MIHTATQIKAKIRNLSGGDSRKAQTLIRNYVMERFLERMSVSKYQDRFILRRSSRIVSGRSGYTYDDGYRYDCAVAAAH